MAFRCWGYVLPKHLCYTLLPTHCYTVVSFLPPFQRCNIIVYAYVSVTSYPLCFHTTKAPPIVAAGKRVFRDIRGRFGYLLLPLRYSLVLFVALFVLQKFGRRIPSSLQSPHLPKVMLNATLFWFYSLNLVNCLFVKLFVTNIGFVWSNYFSPRPIAGSLPSCTTAHSDVVVVALFFCVFPFL